jgi:hypothetical protein
MATQVYLAHHLTVTPHTPRSRTVVHVGAAHRHHQCPRGSISLMHVNTAHAPPPPPPRTEEWDSHACRGSTQTPPMSNGQPFPHACEHSTCTHTQPYCGMGQSCMWGQLTGTNHVSIACGNNEAPDINRDLGGGGGLTPALPALPRAGGCGGCGGGGVFEAALPLSDNGPCDMCRTGGDWGDSAGDMCRTGGDWGDSGDMGVDRGDPSNPLAPLPPLSEVGEDESGDVALP